MQKIIFLDIDGPVIPTPMYFIDNMCSFDRSVVSTIAIGWLRHLVRLSDAKIVCNSAHNYISTGTSRSDTIERDLKQDLIRHGIPRDSFHENWRTKFPNPTVIKMSDHRSNRIIAIEEWIRENGETDWVGFDDEPYTTDSRLVHIDFDVGIDRDAFVKACEQWNLDPNTFVL